MRQLLNRYGIHLGVGLWVLAGVVIYLSFRPGVPSTSRRQAFFVDTETNEVTVRSADEVPPLPGASGRPTIVLAVFVTNDGGKTKVQSYQLKYSERAKHLRDEQKAGHAIEPGQPLDEVLVRLPDNNASWVLADSADGYAIVNRNPFGDGSAPEIVKP